MSSLPPPSTSAAGDDPALATPLPDATAGAPQPSSPDAAGAESAAASTRVDEPFVSSEAFVSSEPAPAAAGAEADAPPAGAQDCGPQLKQLFPALFSNPPKPLKLRIQADIQQRAPGRFTKPQLSAFLRRYTGSHPYLNALVKATHRFDLDGLPGDALSDEHRQAAVDELARRRAVVQARRALEDEQRFNRSILLRDFELTKLDKAGFAALKGVPTDELDGLLERARKEAAEAPPAQAPRRDRRGAPNRGPRDAQERGAPGPRPPRNVRGGPADGAAPAGADVGPAPQRMPTDTPRGPTGDGPRRPRPHDDRAPRADGPRAPQGARAEGDRGPRGPRPEGPRDTRPDAPRGQRDDRPRGPRPDDARPARAPGASAPAIPTAMALAFGALRGLNVDAPAAAAAKPARGGKPVK